MTLDIASWLDLKAIKPSKSKKEKNLLHKIKAHKRPIYILEECLNPDSATWLLNRLK